MGFGLSKPQRPAATAVAGSRHLDHMEVMFDLDTEAMDICKELSINMVRAGSVGVHPQFVSMISELILERTTGAEKQAIGNMPANWDVCPKDCCTYTPRRPKMPT